MIFFKNNYSVRVFLQPKTPEIISYQGRERKEIDVFFTDEQHFAKKKVYGKKKWLWITGSLLPCVSFSPSIIILHTNLP